MYNYQFINKLEQFGRVSYDLLLTDVAGIMPDVRLMKEFKSGEDNDLNSIGVIECDNATKQYNDSLTQQWVISQIQETANLVTTYIQSTTPDLNTLNNVQAIINPVLNFYGLPTLTGLQPVLTNQLNIDTTNIIEAFKQLPITDNTVATTEYFVDQVKKALGVN